MTGKSVYVCTDYHEKQLQRALLQYKKPENANLVREALRLAGREDLIGNTPECLIRPAFGQGRDNRFVKSAGTHGKASGRTTAKGAKSANAKTTKSNAPKSAKGAKKNEPFYQPLVDGKHKKNKLERVFGEDAVAIMREAERIAHKPTTGKDKNVGGAKPNSKNTSGAKPDPKSKNVSAAASDRRGGANISFVKNAEKTRQGMAKGDNLPKKPSGKR